MEHVFYDHRLLRPPAICGQNVLHQFNLYINTDLYIETTCN